MSGDKSSKIPSAMDVHVGRRILDRRKALGISQESLGRTLGITFQQIQKYEKGTNRVGAGRLYDIATSLGVHPGWFFEGDPALVAQMELPRKNDPRQSSAALEKAFSKVEDRRLRRRIVEFVESLSE